MKTVKLEHIKKISVRFQLSTQILLTIYSQPTPHLSLTTPLNLTFHAPTSQLIPEQINQEVNSRTTQTLEA